MSRSSNPARWYSRPAALRDGREVRSTVRAPAARARPIASLVSSSPTPLPRAVSSTTTSSIQARKPVGIGNIASVSVPMIVPSARATSRVTAGEPTIFSSAPRPGGPVVADNCGTSRANAATSSSVTS